MDNRDTQFVSRVSRQAPLGHTERNGQWPFNQKSAYSQSLDQGSRDPRIRCEHVATTTPAR